MAFPTTGVLDDLNRANAATLGANWSANPLGAAGRHRVVSNAAGKDAGNNSSGDRYNVATYGPACEVYLTFPVAPTSGTASAGIVLRLVNPGAGTADAYRLSIDAANGFRIFRYDNGSATQLGAAMALTPANGDTFGLEAVGSTLTAYRKPSGGAWASVGSRTDATYSAAGSLAVATFDSTDTLRWDDVGGGTVVVGGGPQDFDLTPASETDTAQALSVKKRVTLTPATETDTAQAITAEKRVTLAPTSETDTAQALSAKTRVTLAPATESDTAQGLVTEKRVTLTPATEQDVAQELVITQPGGPITLTPATEQDVAQALSVRKRVTLTPALELGEARPLVVRKRATLTPAAEAAVAGILAVSTRVTLAPALTVDSAVALSYVAGQVPVARIRLEFTEGAHIRHREPASVGHTEGVHVTHREGR